jgi:nucleoside permease NupC
MLQNKRQNFHHSKLPEIGTIARLPKEICNGLNGLDYRTKYRVISFPLCDNVRPYSIGIHTCNIKSLKDGREHSISGFWLTR